MACPDHARPAAHTLSGDDLRAFVTSRGQAPALERLRSAQFSKHKLLLTAVMRVAADGGPASHERALNDAYRLLATVETDNREVVDNLIASPQFGAWAGDCVHRLRAEERGPPGQSGQRGGAPLSTDLGHLAAVAAAAAFLTGRAFELDVPLRRGAVTFPGLGTARPGARSPWEWGRVSQDARGRRVRSSVGTVRIPDGDEPVATAGGAWAGLPRLMAEADGLRLEVTLDSRDPFLDRYGTARAMINASEAVRWQRLIGDAWSVLTGGNYPLAELIAAIARTLVPLRVPSPTRSVSVTETSAFGALGLSLPRDALAMAEVLVHESHHAVLGAVTDMVPMLRAARIPAAYAPWREDPRPASALLQGIYTHYGIARFWRQQRRTGPPAQRLRGDVEFGRWRMLTEQVADRLDRLDALTESGASFLATIRGTIARWRDEQVPAAAADQITDLNLEHYACWRVRYLVPDERTVDSLAAAWHRGAGCPIRLSVVAVRLEPGPLPAPTGNARAYLLTLRYQDPAGLREASSRAFSDPADVALAAGDYALAASRYESRIDSGDDGDAWAGLAVARRHTGPGQAARLLAERPEVAAALYRRLRDCGGVSVAALLAWLSDGS